MHGPGHNCFVKDEEASRTSDVFARRQYDKMEGTPLRSNRHVYSMPDLTTEMRFHAVPVRTQEW